MVKSIRDTAAGALWAARRMNRRQALCLSLIVLSGIVLSLNNVLFSVVIKIMLDCAQQGRMDGLKIPMLAFAGLLLIQAGIGSFQSVKQATLCVSISSRIRENIYKSLAGSEWQSYSSFHSDDILTRLTSDGDLVASALVNTVPGMISLIVNVAAAMAVLFAYEPMLALCSFVLGPVGVLLSRIWGARIKKYHKSFQESESSSRERLHEYLQNILIVKAFNLEFPSRERLKQANAKRLEFAGAKAKTSACANIVLYISYALGYCLALCWGSWRMAVSHGTYSFGTFSAFLQLVNQIQGPFSGLAGTLSVLIASLASAERLRELDGIRREAYEPLPVEPAVFGFRFKNVSFSYGTHAVLSGADCEIEPGAVTAVVGPSGEGKTTLLRLILSILKPESGSIFVTGSGGKPLYSAGAGIRRQIAYVPQGNTLFSGTIRENLLLARPAATKIEIISALRSACAWNFVERLPQKIDSKIGEHGLSLSEGQAQRIAIARALLRKSPILVLDEATSALDAETECAVLRAIRRRRQTCILVTHREEPLRICDKILRIGGGAIEELYRAGFVKRGETGTVFEP